MEMFRLLRSSKLILVVIMLSTSVAHGLPFNDDMVSNPMKTGRVMRPLPSGSVSEGSSQYRVETREDALKLTNPNKGDKFSIASGKRLFSVNCSPCHGDMESKPWKPGAVTQFVGAPNISLAMYHDKPDGRTDGSIYGTIRFGSLSGLMPRIGYKLSPTEHWDIINYVRSVQQSTVQ
jgi:mono/diheme cytochrome c family protein